MARKLIGTVQTEKLDKALSKGVEVVSNEGNFSRGVLSTGSTLLDLAISSNRIEGGGIPSGTIVEIFGPSSSGKTAILAEIGASCKHKGGCVAYKDPEGRLDTAYARQCGLVLDKKDYSMPRTVDELEDDILNWSPKPKKKGAINAMCVDSLAAFSTAAEVEKAHKMGAAKRAQSFHQLLRKAGTVIRKNGWILACSNQEQINFETGARKTPGGNGPTYWSSIRIRVAKDFKQGEIKKTWKRAGNILEKAIGIRSTATIVKSSCDDPFRSVPLFILFGQGIDDIRGNLNWLKETENTPNYVIGKKSFSRVESAIDYIEETENETWLRGRVIRLWAEIEDHFRQERKPKKRF
jgi:recombination protein RecA